MFLHLPCEMRRQHQVHGVKGYGDSAFSFVQHDGYWRRGGHSVDIQQRRGSQAVSYTHLTLPTIYSV